MIMRYLGSLLFLSLSFISNTTFSMELKVAFADERPPFCFYKNKSYQGIEIDLVKEIMAKSGHTIKVVIMPKVRHLASTKEKKIDAGATVQDNGDQSLFFTDPYLEFQNIVISKSNLNLEVNSIQDLKKYSFVIWQDGWKNLGKEFEETYRPNEKSVFPNNYYQAYNQLNQNKMFWANRVQLIIVDKYIFKRYQSILSKEYDTNQAVTYHDIFKKSLYSVVFNDANLREQFNQGLKNIRDNGTYQKILDHYKK